MALERLDDRIAVHPLRATLDSLRDALDAVCPEVAEAVREAGCGDVVERAATVVDHLDGLIGAADPQRVSQAVVDVLHAPVRRAAQPAANLPADPAGQSPGLDQALEESLQKTAPRSAATAAFVQSARRIGHKSGSFTGELEKLQGDAEMIGEELAALASRRQTGPDELTNAEDEKRSELGARVQELASPVTERKGADLPNVRWHDRRHLCATQLLELGLDHFAVSVQPGHEDGGALVFPESAARSVPAHGTRQRA